MESAIQDLAREMTESEHVGILELEVDVELALKNMEQGRGEPYLAQPDSPCDDLLLDPWFFRSEEEIAAIEDDTTARVIEIRLADHPTRVLESRWLESAQ